MRPEILVSANILLFTHFDVTTFTRRTKPKATRYGRQRECWVPNVCATELIFIARWNTLSFCSSQPELRTCFFIFNYEHSPTAAHVHILVRWNMYQSFVGYLLFHSLSHRNDYIRMFPLPLDFDVECEKVYVHVESLSFATIFLQLVSTAHFPAFSSVPNELSHQTNCSSFQSHRFFSSSLFPFLLNN